MSSFNTTVYLSENVHKQISAMCCEFGVNLVTHLSNKYKLDLNDELKTLKLSNIKIQNKKMEKENKEEKKDKKTKKIPLPYNGEIVEKCCNALSFNGGLYTQCENEKKNGDFCIKCQKVIDSFGQPIYGTIKERQKQDMFNYVDPKGNRQIPYLKFMKKHKLTKEQVLEEAEKLNITLDEKHFEEIIYNKRGRPKSTNIEDKPKGKKGRPTKKNKQLELTEPDVFEEAIKYSQEQTENDEEQTENDEEQTENDEEQTENDEEQIENDEEQIENDEEQTEDEFFDVQEVENDVIKKVIEEKVLTHETPKKEDKETEKQTKSKKAKKETEKQAKKAEKEAEKQAKKAKKEAEKQAKKAEKEAEKQAKKAEKEAEKKTKKQAKKEETKPNENIEETKIKIKYNNEDITRIKNVTYNGINYLRHRINDETLGKLIFSKEKYIKTNNLVLVGVWNDAKQTIDPAESDREEDENEIEDDEEIETIKDNYESDDEEY